MRKRTVAGATVWCGAIFLGNTATLRGHCMRQKRPVLRKRTVAGAAVWCGTVYLGCKAAAL